MKVVLINPPQTYPGEFFDRSGIRAYIPTGLAQIASCLEKAGYAPKIVDAFTLSNELITEVDGSFHLGAPWEKIKDAVQKEKPGVVGITNPFSSQAHNTARTAALVKEIDSRIVTVVGGPHASARPEDFLSTGNVDYVVLREGERPMTGILQCLDSGKDAKDVPQVEYRDGEWTVQNERCEFIEDLDELPFPAFHLIDLERYFEIFGQGYTSRPYMKTNRAVPVITSRGCPFQCCFCSIHLHMGHKWRHHSPEYVLRYLKYLRGKYDVRHVSFEDDNLTLNNERFEKILDGIIGENLNVTWDTPNGVRADRLDENLIRKAKRSGCKRLVIGVESGDQDVLNTIVNKKLKLENVVKAAALCKKVSLDLHAFFMVGLVGETKQNIQNTFNFAYMLARRYNVAPAFTIACPLIGTPFYETAKKKGYFTKEPDEKDLFLGGLIQTGGLITTEEFDPEYLRGELNRFYRRLFRLQLLKPGYILKRFLRDPKTFFTKARRLLQIAFSSKIRK